MHGEDQVQDKGGNQGVIRQPFICAYDSYMDAAVDYAKFIYAEPQFSAAIKHRNNPIRYAELVADGGYVGGTSKAGREAYKNLLKDVMRQFRLRELDSQIWLKRVVIHGK